MITGITIRTFATFTAVCVFGALALPVEAAPARDVVIEWNALAQKTITGGPFPQSRAHAMVQIAVADAVVSIEGKYQPFHGGVNAGTGADARAAAAQAAHDVLTALVPDQAAAFDELLNHQLQAIPASGRGPGRSVGRRTAAKVLAWRAFDGYADANPIPSILPSELPGVWQETGSGPALFGGLGNALPMGLLSSTQFLPANFPQLDSEAYAEDYNEVKSLGEAGSTTRTERQTMLASLVANAPGPWLNVTHPLRVWHNVIADTARSQKLNLVDTARLFALVMASIHDSLQTSHTSKFVYRLWRPVTAVEHADIDGNDATEAQAGWVPLLFTPPYPSHSSNAACIGAGASRMLANVLGKDSIPFSATWYSSDAEDRTVVHSEPYASFSAFSHDFGSSRVWGGIHFTFEIDTSQHSCTMVADYLYDNYMNRKGP